MKKPLFLLLAIILGFSSLFAQNENTASKSLTIEDAVIGQYRQLYPEYILNLRWRDAKHYTFIKDYNAIQQTTISNLKTKTLFSLDDINAMYHKAGLDSLSYIVKITWLNLNQFSIEQAHTFVIVDAKKKKIIKKISFDKKAANVMYQKENGFLTYTKDNNLYINDGQKEIAVTKDTDENIINGQFVHRNEFGINSGIFWSPKGKYLAYYHKDQTMVGDYPLVDITKREAELKNIKYPMAGMKSEEVKLAVYNPVTQKTIYLKTGTPKEQYLTNISWSPDEKEIYIQVLNREQNHMWLNKYDAQTGDFIKTLFEEKNERYVELEHPIVFLKNNPKEFLIFSERDGWNHLYRYNTEGKLLGQVDKGDWVNLGFIGFDQSGKNILIYTNIKGGLEKQVAKVSISTGKMQVLTKEDGQHTARLNPYADYFVDGFTSITVPHDYYLASLQKGKLKKIQSAKNPLADYKLGEMTIGKIKAADGKTDLFYRLITPPDFDKNKKYPALVYVYGGPHAQLIKDAWLASAQMWLFYMAQKGYVVFTVDNRGSAHRGFEFESIIHRNLGVAEMKDQLKGVDFLKSLSFVDTAAIGVDGWSYGGFMTTNLMLTYPNVFKVAVAGGPVIDWKYYEIMYGERYMDTPEENPEGYEQANLTKKVKNLKGRLMIIHGAQDNTVVWQHSQAFLRACIKNNILLDYFIYPTHEHNVRGKDRVHLMRKITQYFDDFLKK